MTSADGLIIATELTSDTTGTAWFEPMLHAAQDGARLIAAHRPAAGDGGIKLFLADAGYMSEHNLTIPGPDRLIATGKHRDLEKATRDSSSAPPAPARISPLWPPGWPPPRAALRPRKPPGHDTTRPGTATHPAPPK